MTTFGNPGNAAFSSGSDVEIQQSAGIMGLQRIHSRVAMMGEQAARLLESLRRISATMQGEQVARPTPCTSKTEESSCGGLIGEIEGAIEHLATKLDEIESVPL